MATFYSTECDYNLPPGDVFAKVRAGLSTRTSITNEDSANWHIDAKVLHPSAARSGFAISAQVSPVSGSSSRLVLSASAIDGIEPDASSARKLFSVLLGDVEKSPGATIARLMTSKSAVMFIVGGVIAILIGQAIKGHYAAYNALCTGYTPGSGTGCSAYVAWYDIGTWLFVLGILAVVGAIGLLIAIHTKTKPGQYQPGSKPPTQP